MMKYRNDFVTNSSSSSFIITNKSDESMDAKDILMSWLKDILKDSEEVGLYLSPGESIELECTDNRYENAFETFIHNVFDGYSGVPVNEDEVSVRFGESHH